MDMAELFVLPLSRAPSLALSLSLSTVMEGVISTQTA